MNELYTIIKEQCEAQGVTVSRMCLEVGLKKSVLSDLKHDRKQTLSLRTLQKISDYLGTPISVFLGEEPARPETEYSRELQLLKDNPETRVLLNATKGMTPEQVRKMTDLILSMKG